MRVRINKIKGRKNVVFSTKTDIRDVTPEKALSLSKKYDITVLSHDVNKRKKGKRVIFLQELIYKIGGIEEFLTNIAAEYSEYDLTFYYHRGDPEQLINLSKYVNLRYYDDNTIQLECDVLLISNHTITGVVGNQKVKAKKKYAILHANFKELERINDVKFQPIKGIDGYITVSKSAHDGLWEMHKIESKVIYNFISNKNVIPKMTKFIVLSRATKEKGIDKIVEMCEKFKEQEKIFILFLCSTLEQLEDEALLNRIKSIPEIVLIPPSIYNKNLISSCDYVVQLSKSDSYCYALREGLKRNVPIICTNFKEAYNFVKDGENGYMLNMDLSNLDVDKIFNEIPQHAEYEEFCDKRDWVDIFEGRDIFE